MQQLRRIDIVETDHILSLETKQEIFDQRKEIGENLLNAWSARFEIMPTGELLFAERCIKEELKKRGYYEELIL